MGNAGCCQCQDGTGGLITAEPVIAHPTTAKPHDAAGPQPKDEETEGGKGTGEPVYAHVKEELPVMAPPPVDPAPLPEARDSPLEPKGSREPPVSQAEEPEAPQDGELEQLHITLERPKGAKMSLGMNLYVCPAHLCVQSVTDGMVKTWNLQNPGEEVKQGAVIIEVNGIKGDSQKIFDALRQDAVLKVKLLRVPSFNAIIDKTGPFGVDIGSTSMQIKHIKDQGPVEMYNRTCRAGYQLSPGDTIVSVNDITGDPTAMLREVSTAVGKVSFGIRRQM